MDQLAGYTTSVNNTLGYPQRFTVQIIENYFLMSEILSIGIDVSSRKLDVYFWGQTTQYHTIFSNDTEGIASLLAALKEASVSLQPVVMEATGFYHWQVALGLSKEGLNLKVINPIITKKHQRASVRGAKTDKVDAARLAQIGLVEPNLPTFCDTLQDLTNKQHQALLKKLVHLRQQAAAALQSAQSVCKQIGINLELDSLIEVLASLEKAIEAVKTRITEKACSLATKLANDIKGLSLIQISIICNATINKKFNNRDQLVAFFGLDVKQRQSGTWQGKQALSKRGNSFFRLILFQIGWGLATHNATYKEYYKQLKEIKKKHYYTAILATARKFLRYYFKELKEFQSLRLVQVG